MWQQLICIVLLCVGIQCITIQKCPDFSCPADQNMETKVKLFGTTTLTCPEDMVCNKLGVDNCTPCISRCFGKYSCKTGVNSTVENIVVVGKLEFQCDDNFYCQPSSNNCNLCVPQKCNPKSRNFECLDGNLKYKEPDGTVRICKNGSVCNNQWEYPCQICIPSLG